MSIPSGAELPRGWAVATIDDLVGAAGVFTDGDWVESKDQDPEGDVRLTQLADIGDGEFLNRSARFLTSDSASALRCTFVERGDLLVARMPEPIARGCVFPGDRRRAVTAVDVCIVRTGSPGVNHRWLMWFINSPDFRAAAALLQSGSTRKRISRKNLSTVRLPVPPRDEQDRIVDELDTHFTRLDAAVAALKRVRANLKRYRASVLKAACEGRLVPTAAELARRKGRDYEPADALLERILQERRARWEADELAKLLAKGNPRTDDRWKRKYKEPAPPDTGGLPELPEGWVWATAEQLIVNGPQNGLYLPKRTYGSGVPILRIDDFQVGWSRPATELQRVNASDDDTQKYMLNAHDIVLNRVNSPSHLGKCIAIDERNTPALFESNIMRLRLSDMVDPRFVVLWLTSAGGRDLLLRDAKWAVNQASINQGDVKSTGVPLPPRNEQLRILSEYERRSTVAAARLNGLEANSVRADRLRQSILKRAFEGRLVPQDPTDEPASVLLERIRAEREKGGRRPSGRQERHRKRADSGLLPPQL